MAKIIEGTPQRMTLQSGSTTLILDKDVRHRGMQHPPGDARGRGVGVAGRRQEGR
jgi:hypothetical protein